MIENRFLPEGNGIYSKENISYTSTLSGLERAISDEAILEGRVISCDSELNLHVELPCGAEGIIPHSECLCLGEGESPKDIAIITRVGKPVCFKALSVERDAGAGARVILSRRAAQAECRSYYLSSLLPGDIIPATVTHLDTFGAFVDVGCGISSLLCIDCISVSRISHPSERLCVGQRIYVAVKSNDRESGRLYVSLKELLGTWEENASHFFAGHTVGGIVRSIEDYGIFVELAPNLAGLAEIREGNRTSPLVCVGDRVSVYIKSIIPERMKIKLVLIDVNQGEISSPLLQYYIDPEKVTHIDRWQYSPEGCARITETIFT